MPRSAEIIKITISDAFKAHHATFGSLFGAKSVYGLHANTQQYLLYDGDKGYEETTARIWATAERTGVQVIRIATVTGESLILRACNYASLFAQRNGFHPDCCALAYYHGVCPPPTLLKSNSTTK